MTNRDLFIAALNLDDPAERRAYLHEACGTDSSLRQRVEALLKVHENAGSFLESPLATPTLSTGSALSTEITGSLIGPYKLLQPIGEGGMGTVYMAEQTVPVRRTVALKLIKAGMDSRQVLARFGAERQALALMDHPNIAKVFDAGTTDTGRPYFVMELVKGIPITRFCDERRLTTRERLELAIPVCQAVQHAHQKGIIHRDLKPSNILIALYDGKSVPKVIDFGVAKATGPRLTDETLYTEFGAVVGTLEYMSPEQAELNQLDIDTRSDIYSLGVLLYELLTGSTPLDRKRLKQGAILEMLRVIREEESPVPSMRLSTTEELPSIAACRSIEPRKLSGLMRGELDWIVMKALEKDRNRRYETAIGLAADLRRYLDDEPVQACPPSAWYRFGKFARRNKAGLTVAGLIMMAILSTIGILAVSNVLINHEKANKETALLKARDSAKEATYQREIADKNAGLANTQRGMAIANERAARVQELLSRRRFHAAQTNLAQQAWEAGQPSRVLELLESLRPKFDQEDLRGFEWYYLRGLCQAGFIASLRGHTGPIWGVSFSPDGKTLASNSLGNIGWAGHHSAVKLWDVATRRERRSLKEFGLESYWSSAFSPDGRVVVAVGPHTPVKFWDTASGREIVSFQRFSRFVAFFADGKTVVTGKPQSGSAGNDLELWDAITGQEKAVLRTSPGEDLLSVAVAPDGKHLAVGTSSEAIRSWSWEGTRWRDEAPIRGHGWGGAVAFSPDSKNLAVSEGLLKSYEVGSGRETVSFRGHIGLVRGLAFSPDGKTLASGGTDRTLRTWDTVTGMELTRRPHPGPVISVAFSPDSKTLAAGCGDTNINLWEAGPAAADVVLPHGGKVCSLAFSPDSRTLVSSGLAPTRFWDAATGGSCATPPMEWARAMTGEDIAPDARSQAFQGPDRTVTLCNLATGRPGAVLRGHTGFVYGVAYAPGGKTVATASDDGTARLWDTATGRPLVTIRPMVAGVAPGAGVSAVAFSPDGTLLATGTQFEVVTLWDATTGRERLALQTGERVGTGSWIWSVAFSPDGKILAVSSDQGTVRLWDVTTGASRGSLKGHTDSIRCLAFSPDGESLVTGSDDRTAKLWDAATCQERLTLKGHTAAVLALAFSPDGMTLATGSADTTVRLWRSPRDPEASACDSEEDPDAPDTAQALNTAGERLWSIGRPEESEKAFHLARARASKLMGAVPGNLLYRQELARTWLCLGLLFTTRERLHEADNARREAAELLKSLTPKARQTLGFHFSELADLFRASGHADDADAASLQSVQLGPDNPMLWYKRTMADVKLGLPERVIADYSRLIALSPNDATFLNDLAWLLVTCEKPGIRDPGRAVDLARKAVGLAAGERMYWNTLGVAHYRAGDWKQAVEPLTKSMELGKGGDGNDWYILAMAHWQLGDKTQARSWYDKAVPWMEKNQPKNEELVRFRAEAAALLEVNEKQH